MRTWGLAPAVALAALMACGGGDGNGPGDEDTAQLRVIHMLPEVTAIDVSVDGDLVANNFVYEQVGSYVEVPAGAVELAVIGGGGAELVRVSPSLARDAQYTVVVTGLVDDPQAFVYTDDNTPPSGAAVRKLRLLHAAPTGQTVDLYLVPVDEEDPTIRILENVNFAAPAPYVEAPSGDYSFVLTVTGTLTEMFSYPLYDFDENYVHTLVLGESPGGGPPFNGFFLRDTLPEGD